MTEPTQQPDWEMLLSKIELEINETYVVDSLDSSDQSKWGDDYKRTNEIATRKSNEAVRVATMAFRQKLLNTLRQRLGGK